MCKVTLVNCFRMILIVPGNKKSPFWVISSTKKYYFVAFVLFMGSCSPQEVYMNLLTWKPCGSDLVFLIYEDGDVVKVSRSDFDRCFGPIVSGSKDAIKRDFGI